MTKKVAILMGSANDADKMQPAREHLERFGVDHEVWAMSAHRTADAVREFVGSARTNGFGVIIAAAGMAAHLAGACAANTTLPVIGVPLSGGALDGVDSLYATVQMPPGMPVATVAINGAANAALLAVQILAVTDADLEAKLGEHRSTWKPRQL
ncbi:MAG: 5-(carboxyamino)imidazole ribonucleotide mutase [Actinobacteria bacterium]|nr:5-(carboxyamino)imidazole ribonucleotide mutase [Actinomycetota bacterium]MBW3649718.1 5-(carboxyamino)imidazole ribonucleotide mutase [Actinomycetota bacterium]